MGWTTYTHASINARRPEALGVCDRCGSVYLHRDLSWDYQWAGTKLMNLRILVCPTCLDKPQEQLRTIIFPADPVPITNARPGEFSGMNIQANPDVFNTIVPSPLTVESTTSGTTIGDRSPLVTENSSLIIVTEITVTPNPDPNFGGGGYTRQGSS